MKWLVYLFAFLVSLLLLASCTDCSKESRFLDRKLVFEKEGGSQIARIDLRKHSWRFESMGEVVYSTKERRYSEVSSESIKRSTLPDGREEIRCKWARFIVSQDRRVIVVEVEPNESGLPRELYFSIIGWHPACGNILNVIQKP